jgi:single-stranded DNA-specific DHH superfamily exonuclease
MSTYLDKHISGAVADMVIPENVAAYAIRKGLYLIGQNGEHLELRNEAEFVARFGERCMAESHCLGKCTTQLSNLDL